MLERIAAALEIDTPQLFSMESLSDEAIQKFQNGVLSDMEAALTLAVNSRLPELKNVGS